MKITVKIPSRGRPEQLLETLQRWHLKAANPSGIEFVVSIDDGDFTMRDPNRIRKFSFLQNYKMLSGPHKSKQEAVNADLDECTGDIILHICDDVICKMEHWDLQIYSDMMAHFPDLDGVLHYPDGIQNENLCTHPVIGRKYLQRFGYVSHPSYLGLYADNEFTLVARHLKKIKYIDKQIFEHDHPLKGNRKADALNARDEKNSESDRLNFEKRQREGFDGILAPKPVDPRPHVLVAVLSRGDWNAETAGCICGLFMHASHFEKDYVLRGVLEQQCSDPSPGRNHAVEQALTLEGLTHLLFVDSDATFPPDTISKLLANDMDVVACRALRRMPPYTPTGTMGPGAKWVIGCHVMLIKMSVFSQIDFPWFNGHYKGRSYVSEDHDFCHKVNRFSGGVYCDEELSKKIGHLGKMNFTLAMAKEPSVV